MSLGLSYGFMAESVYSDKKWLQKSHQSTPAYFQLKTNRNDWVSGWLKMRDFAALHGIFHAAGSMFGI